MTLSSRRVLSLAEARTNYDVGADEYRRKVGDIAAKKLFVARLDVFAPVGDVLELACGAGLWTVELLRHAASVTAVDGSLRMLLFFDDADRPEEEQVEGPSSATVERRLEDGSRHRIVKIAWEPPALAARLAAMGWVMSVESVDGPFYAGAGGRARDLGAR